MRITPIISPVTALLVLAVLMRAVNGDAGTPTARVESFDTVDYADLANTTAFWDTAGGELRLPPYQLQALGVVSTPSSAPRVTVDGDYAFVAASFAGLFVFDISDPSDPSFADSIYTTEQVVDVDIQGDYAYLANNFAGLYVLDVSDPTDLSIVSDVFTDGQTIAVDVEGDQAYLADGPRGLRVIDISDPASPLQIGEYNTPGYAQDIVVDGNVAYIADWWNGLQVIDVSDPETPSLLSQYDTPGLSRAIAVDGSRLYLCDSGDGLHIFDISDPSAPLPLGNFDSPGLARGVDVAGAIVYLADHADGLHVIDARNPAAPRVLSSYSKAGLCHWPRVRGAYIYMADGDGGMAVFRAADVPAPAVSGQATTSVGANTGAVTYKGTTVYVGGNAGVGAFDADNPWSLQAQGQSAFSEARDLVVSGDWLFAASQTGLATISIVDPASPTLVDDRSVGSPARAIDVDGNTVFVASDSGLVVVDIFDAAAWVTLDTLKTGSYADVLVAGDRVYAAVGGGAGSDVLHVIDVEDRENPSLVGTLPGSEPAWALARDGDLLYLAGNMTPQVTIVEISDPASPQTMATFATGGSVTGLFVAGELLVASTTTGLESYDVTEPLAVAQVGSAGATALGPAAVRGDYAFAAGSDLSSYRITRRDGDPAGTIAVTTPINQSVGDIIRVRIDPDRDAASFWCVNADGGPVWQSVPPGVWSALDVPGGTLRWRAELDYDPVGGSFDPRVTSVRADWLHAFPTIDDVADVADDQGHLVLLRWRRSGHDFPEAAAPAMAYTVLRKNALGLWDSLTTVDAATGEWYTASVATLADSTRDDWPLTSYRVRVRLTDGSMITSPPDSGYSVDNIAPEPPSKLWVGVDAGENVVGWSPSPSRDVVRYHVYRADAAPVPLDSLHLVHSSPASRWVDAGGGPGHVYAVTALDGSNESGATGMTVVSDADGKTPARLALAQNVPNPFNPSTVIRYQVPRPGARVRLRVFDVRGRLVRTLVDEPRAQAGNARVTWDGTDDRGVRVASGVYFYRLRWEGRSLVRKMLLLQ